MINVTIWNENCLDKDCPRALTVYPDGIHNELKRQLSVNGDFCIRTATLQEPECGLTDEVLDNTDVLLWWAHGHSAEVPDEIVKKVCDRVRLGMGFIPLHSAHVSKPFLTLMGTSGRLTWREDDRERLWTVAPSHPIAEGVPLHIDIPAEEMYGEPFGIPEPDRLVFIGWFQGGEVFRSGCCYIRDAGKIFYFQPGHESNPTYKNPDIVRILSNAVRWAYNPCRNSLIDCDHEEALEMK